MKKSLILAGVLLALFITASDFPKAPEFSIKRDWEGHRRHSLYTPDESSCQAQQVVTCRCFY